jgi:hypothetical protein
MYVQDAGRKRPFKVLGLQQIAIGALDKKVNRLLWSTFTKLYIASSFGQINIVKYLPLRLPSLRHVLQPLLDLWQGLLGVPQTGSYTSKVSAATP